MDTVSNLITARDFASLLGYHTRTAEGKPTNHCRFLDRLKQRYPSEFPQVRWLGERRFFDLVEVARFKENLPRKKPDKMKAA